MSCWFYIDIENAAIRLYLCWSFESKFNKGREREAKERKIFKVKETIIIMHH